MTTNKRESYTADLGGVMPEDAGPPAESFAKGDRVLVNAPQLEKYHGKQGTIVEDMGTTKNGPRLAVHLDGMDLGHDLAFPPIALQKVLTSKQRFSYTELGGVLPPDAANAEPPALGWVAPGDRVRVKTPGFEKFHEKEGTVVEDMGQTKNGPRVAVHLDDMPTGQDVAFPPGVLARVAVKKKTPPVTEDNGAT